MIFPIDSHLLVQYDELLSLMRFQWVDSTGMSTNVRAGLKRGQDLVYQYQPLRAIVDLRGLPDLSMEDQLWITLKWLPYVAQQSLQHAALVLPETITMHNQMAVEAVLKVARHLLRFDVQFFTDVATALDWTTDSSARILALEEEWELAWAAQLT